MATSKRGFASMDPAKQREIASKGGRAAHAKGTAHEFTSDEARVAGRKGGEAVSRDRAHMAAIGREGGHSRGQRARAAAAGVGVGAAPAGAALHNRDRNDNDFSSTPQPYVRQANEDRNVTFETSRTSASASGGFGASDRNERTNERDKANEGGPLSNRDRI